MKIVVYNLREFDEKPFFDKYCEMYGYEYIGTPLAPSYENAELAEGAEAISIIPCKMDRELIRRFHNLGVKYITTRSVGAEHIDVIYARALGMRVSNVSYSSDSVANYAIMLMLMGCRKMKQIMERASIQDYSLKGKMGKELSECTVGVIGTGKIGTTVLRHLSGFGCRLLACSRTKRKEAEKYAAYVSLEKLYQEADIISLHLLGIEKFHHMISESAIAQMKQGVMLINTSRGSLIDEGALIRGLDGGKIGFAGLDTIENETGLYYFNHTGKILRNHNLAILQSYPNVIVTSHNAFYTDKAIADQVECTIKNIDAFENNKETVNEIH